MSDTTSELHDFGNCYAKVTRPPSGPRVMIAAHPGQVPVLEGKHVAGFGELCAKVSGQNFGGMATCGWCGAAYPSDQSGTREHFEKCPSHPMRAVERERDALRQELADAKAQPGEWRALNAGELVVAGDEFLSPAQTWKVAVVTVGVAYEPCVFNPHRRRVAAPALAPFDVRVTARACFDALAEIAGRPTTTATAMEIDVLVDILRALPTAKPVTREWCHRWVGSIPNSCNIGAELFAALHGMSAPAESARVAELERELATMQQMEAQQRTRAIAAEAKLAAQPAIVPVSPAVSLVDGPWLAQAVSAWESSIENKPGRFADLYLASHPAHVAAKQVSVEKLVREVEATAWIKTNLTLYGAATVAITAHVGATIVAGEAT